MKQNDRSGNMNRTSLSGLVGLTRDYKYTCKHIPCKKIIKLIILYTLKSENISNIVLIYTFFTSP